MSTIIVAEEIAAIVKKVNADVLDRLQAAEPTISGVHYDFGPGEEILETLAQKDQAKSMRTRKYPLIALIMDFDEDRNPAPGVYANTDFRIVICHHTMPEYKTQERYEKVFKPILYPIYGAFMDRLKTSGLILVNETGEIPHVKRDKPYYGDAEGNEGNDFLDAIVISDLRLSWYLPTNCPCEGIKNL